jgi:hypothetical protein
MCEQIAVLAKLVGCLSGPFQALDCGRKFQGRWQSRDGSERQFPLLRIGLDDVPHSQSVVMKPRLRAELIGTFKTYCDGEKVIEPALKKISCVQ